VAARHWWLHSGYLVGAKQFENCGRKRKTFASTTASRPCSGWPKVGRSNKLQNLLGVCSHTVRNWLEL